MNRLLRPLGRDLRAALDDDVAASGLARPAQIPPRIGPDDLAALPDTAQRYLRFMGAIGRTREVSFRAHAKGRFRLRPNQRFMPSEVWQYNSALEIARLFHMRIDFGGFLPMVGRDRYVRGHGSMRGSLLGVVKVADGHGPEFDVVSIKRNHDRMGAGSSSRRARPTACSREIPVSALKVGSLNRAASPCRPTSSAAASVSPTADTVL